RTALESRDRQQMQPDRRRAALEAERSAANLDELAQALQALDTQHSTLREEVETLTRGLEERPSAAERLLESERALHTALSGKRGELEKTRGRLASLEALQHD